MPNSPKPCTLGELIVSQKRQSANIDDFILPFDGALRADNRWVIKNQLIPWDDIEGDYAYLFPSGTGNHLGYKKYTDEKPFDPSLMVRFRQRFSVKQLNALNIRYCQERGICISGTRLGRPPKEPDPKVVRQSRQDARDRNCSEGKFGEGKRRYGIALIMANLRETSETVIIMNLIVMNLARVQRGLFVCFSKSVFRVFWAKFMLPAGQLLLAAA